MLKNNVMIKGQNHYNTVNSDGGDGRTLPSTRKKCTKQGSSPETHHLSEENRHV